MGRWPKPFTTMSCERVVHPFEPVWDDACTILILGSLPSVQSRKQNFYYGHPQNRFWKVLAAVFDCPVPETIADKKSLLLRHHIALWDVIRECEISGSSDASIKNVVPNDLDVILSHAPISRILCNGKAAEKYYRKYYLSDLDPVVLPSTSAANASWSFERLVSVWKSAICEKEAV